MLRTNIKSKPNKKLLILQVGNLNNYIDACGPGASLCETDTRRARSTVRHEVLVHGKIFDMPHTKETVSFLCVVSNILPCDF